ncbi:DUF6273 domain-containing protein [Acetobacterium sp.]|uniref:DUF6273 domain-containing protein n=1 Tax=Acetobacterium sp. TaxID=1872094 RepID=UPI0035940EC2
MNYAYGKPSEKQQRNCPTCGFIFTNNGSFCPECGAKRVCSDEQAPIKKDKYKSKNRKTTLIIGLCIVLCIISYFIFQTIIKPAVTYNNAMSLIEDQQYKAAIDQLNELGDYKDSEEKQAKYQLLLINQASVGDVVTFGSYNQDKIKYNLNELIEWRVVTKEGDKVLLLSNSSLDRQPYNNTSSDTTWETCSLRLWLNDIFLNSAFSTEQQSLIAMSNLTNANNPKYATNGGNNTQDKVFVLSVVEVEKYSLYTKDWTPSSGSNGWRLRTPGKYGSYAATVYNYDEYIDYFEYSSTTEPYPIRPAIWVYMNANV